MCMCTKSGLSVPLELASSLHENMITLLNKILVPIGHHHGSLVRVNLKSGTLTE